MHDRRHFPPRLTVLTGPADLEDPAKPKALTQIALHPIHPDSTASRLHPKTRLEQGHTIYLRYDNGPTNNTKPAGPTPISPFNIHHSKFHTELRTHGPAIDIAQLEVNGPVRLVDDQKQLDRRARTARFLGQRASSNPPFHSSIFTTQNSPAFARQVLQRLLTDAFRRPVDTVTLDQYTTLVLDHVSEQDGRRLEDGLHLAVRMALCSPRFLYRGRADGQLDAYDLASRLSYFLHGSPPDATLLAKAADGSLTTPDVLESQARRLLKSGKTKNFLDSFLGQWLDLRLLPDIMPDQRLLQNFSDRHLTAVQQEPALFVKEILDKNHPLETFIDPDFTYLNRRTAQLYRIDFAKSDVIKRVKIPKGGRHGGLLGMAAVRLATANGVDTQPVLRGAWLLENILGKPTPPPPPDVPAVEPDTTGATTIRELLDRHAADASCASCHQHIDPVGFALENFDPIGRWRDHYPIYQPLQDGTTKTLQGLPVDAIGTMPDGATFQDVTDLKAYLITNIDLFSHCLAEKLLTYATGRIPTYPDRLLLEAVVAEVKANGNGFQDFIVNIILSEAFATK